MIRRGWGVPRGLFLAVCLLAVPPFAVGSEPGPEAVLAEMPFLESTERNRIFVDLAPPDAARPFPLLLDTGARTSVVTPRMARALGVSVRRLKFDPYRQSTRLGRDLLFYVDASLTDTGGRSCEYGLLGGNFLEDYVVEPDFPGRSVRLLDADRYQVPEQASGPDEAVLPLLVVARRPAIEVEVNGERFPLLIDTGAPHGLLIDAGLAERAGVESEPVAGFEFGTVLGPVASELGSAEGLVIGPFAFENVPVVVLPNGWFNFTLAKEGVIGFDVLSQFLVRIDYPRRRILLRRRPDWQVAWKGEPWSGWPENEPPAQGVTPDTTPVVAAALVPAAARSPRAAVEPGALEPARPAAAAPRSVWLEVAQPREGEAREGRLAWVEVSGWAGSESALRHDVVVVVDTSGSTAWASGADVDGDGKTGKARRRVDAWRSFNPRHYSSDAGDTILAAELLATRRLVGLLDPVRTRVGIVSFADGATLLAPVGSSRAELAAALGILAENFGSGSTNLSAALDLATQALLAAGGKGRGKSILVLSDGYPTAPAAAPNGNGGKGGEAVFATSPPPCRAGAPGAWPCGVIPRVRGAGPRSGL